MDNADSTAQRARTLAEIATHVGAWNALPAWQRAFILRSALPVEAAAFVAHSNALEGLPTLSAADTLEMVQQPAATAHDPAAEHALNTHNAFCLARAFRLERAEAGAGAADELLWHVPQVLAVHRTLMASIHPRAGRLRVCDARPNDRDTRYVPSAAVRATLWSFFDVANGRAIRLSGDPVGAGSDAAEALEQGEASVLDVDDAVNEVEFARLLAEAPAGPDLRDIDPQAVEGVVEHAAWFAAHFLEIHPFGDGNGRLTRVLVDSILARVHPVPAPLVPVGASLEEARARYLTALREVPPWGQDGGAAWARSAPARLHDLILESLVASWRRLASIQCSLFGGGAGPFLGVLVLSVRASAASRRVRYSRLGHGVRALVAGVPAFAPFAPSGREEDGWCSVGWMP